MNDCPRIGIFQAGGALQSQTVNAITVLVERGYYVDVFFYNVSRDFQDIPTSLDSQRLRVLNFQDTPNNITVSSPAPQPTLKKKIRNKIRSWPWLDQKWRQVRSLQYQLGDTIQYWLHLNDLDFVMPRQVLEQTKAKMAGQPYRCLIGVEKLGLVWAGAIVQETAIPLVYYSLELYTQEYFTPRLLREFPGFASRWFRRLKRLEPKYHRLCQATIIQDVDRKQVLFQDNRLDADQLCFFVPVSLLGPPTNSNKDLWRNKWGIPSDARVLLYFGLMRKRRYVLDLVRVAQNFPPGWVLVVHGYSPESDFLQTLEGVNTAKRAIISTALVPSSEIDALISAADIGLVLYSNETANEFLTGKSSEKMALYARAGIPMIAFNYPSFVQIFSEYKCGICIERVTDIEDCTKSIFANYEKYHEGALHAYEQVYEFSRHFSNFVDWIESLPYAPR